MARSRSTPAGSQPATGSQPAHSIPAAVRGAPAGDDLFDALGDDGSATVKEKGKKAERPEVPLPPAVVEAFKRFVGSKVLAEIVLKRAENSEAEVDRAVFDLWQESLWKYKSQPTNPALKLDKDGQPGKRDMEALFQVQDRFTKNNIHMPEPAEGETIQAATVRLLTEMGVPKEQAEAFLANEVEMRPVKSLRAFNELLFGHQEGKDFKEATDEEKAVAKKIMGFVQNELTPEERKLVLVTTPQVTVKKGVIGRVPVYAKALDHVKAIFRVFSPVHFVGKAKLGLNDTPAEKVERLKGIAGDIIGNSDV